MENRIALIGIILESRDAVDELNHLLSQYGEYVIGRMGIPYREKGIHVISVALDAPNNVISALSGKLGMLPGSEHEDDLREKHMNMETANLTANTNAPADAGRIKALIDKLEQDRSLTRSEWTDLIRGRKPRDSRVSL